MDAKFRTWQESFGLAMIDNEDPSYVLQSIAEANIIGLINDKEAEKILKEYYREKNDPEGYQRDLVMLRIKMILNSKEFDLSKDFFCAIHRFIFRDTPYEGGQIRTVFRSKKEDILNGGSVIYAAPDEIHEFLDYDFGMQQKRKMKGLSKEDTIKLIIPFTSNIWQAHPFLDGNTRTTSIFIEKYLQSLGFPINNTIFRDNSLYFRNALVRNNPNSANAPCTTEFLYKFFYKLLLDETIELNPDEQKISTTRT